MNKKGPTRDSLLKSYPKKLPRANRSQQEMVGFVLIVVIVIVALMVFLVISVRKPSEIKESAEVENLLDVLMDHTTECAVISEPDYDSVKDLVKSHFILSV